MEVTQELALPASLSRPVPPTVGIRIELSHFPACATTFDLAVGQIAANHQTRVRPLP